MRDVVVDLARRHATVDIYLRIHTDEGHGYFGRGRVTAAEADHFLVAFPYMSTETVFAYDAVALLYEFKVAEVVDAR